MLISYNALSVDESSPVVPTETKSSPQQPEAPPTSTSVAMDTTTPATSAVETAGKKSIPEPPGRPEGRQEKGREGEGAAKKGGGRDGEGTGREGGGREGEGAARGGGGREGEGTAREGGGREEEGTTRGGGGREGEGVARGGGGREGSKEKRTVFVSNLKMSITKQDVEEKFAQVRFVQFFTQMHILHIF